MKHQILSDSQREGGETKMVTKDMQERFPTHGEHSTVFGTFLGGKRSMDPASASYLPSVFDHSINKGAKTGITRASRNAGFQVDHKPKMTRNTGNFYKKSLMV